MGRTVGANKQAPCAARQLDAHILHDRRHSRQRPPIYPALHTSMRTRLQYLQAKCASLDSAPSQSANMIRAMFLLCSEWTAYLIVNTTEQINQLVRRTDARVGEAEADGLQHRALIYICGHVCCGL